VAVCLLCPAAVRSDVADWPQFWRGHLDAATVALLDDAYGRFTTEQPDMVVYDRAATALEAALDAAPPAPDRVAQLQRGRAWMFVGELLAAQGKDAAVAAAEARGVALIEATLPRESSELAQALISHANTWMKLGQSGKAIDYYLRGLDAYDLSGHAPNYMYFQALYSLAAAYQSLGDNSRAQALLLRSLSVSEALNGPQDALTAMVLAELGASYQAAGRFDLALPLLQRSLAIRERALGPKHRNTAQSLVYLAELYWAMGRYTEAVPLLQRAVAIYEEQDGPDHLRTVTAQSDLGILYRELGQYAQALPLLQHSLAVREKLQGPDDAGTAAALDTLASLYQRMGQYTAALPLFQRALAIREHGDGPDTVGTAFALNNLAMLYQDMGRYGSALPLCERSLAIFEKLRGPEHPDTAVELNNLASMHQRMGQYEKALPLYQRALAIQQRVLGTEHATTATTLENLADLYAAMGRYADALPLAMRSVAIDEKALGPAHPVTARALNSLGTLYREMGRYEEAVPSLRRALEIREQVLGPDHPQTLISLNDLANAYAGMGEYAQALPLYQRSLALGEKVLGPDHPDTATVLGNLATLQQSTGHYPDALALLQRALAIHERQVGFDQSQTAAVLLKLGWLRMAMQQPREALPSLLRAESFASRAVIPEVSWRTQFALSRVFDTMHEPQLAIFWGKQAVRTLQGLRANLPRQDRAGQELYLSDKREAYSELSDRLIAQGRIPESQAVMLMLKDEEYFDFTQRDATSDPGTVDLPLTGVEQRANQQFYAVRDRLAALGQEQARLLDRQASGEATTADLQRLGELQQPLQAATKAFDDFMAGLEALLAGDAATAGTSREIGDQVRSSTTLLHDLTNAGQHVAALQYVVSQQRLHLIVTTATMQLAHEVSITPAQLAAKISAFRDVVQDPRLDPRPPGRELYALLIGPVRHDLEAQHVDTLMLVLDDVLRYVPFAALVDGDRYLVEEYRLAQYTEGAKSRLAVRSDRPWQVLALGMTRAVPELNLDALTAVREELEGIVGPGELPGVVKLDGEFTRAALQSGLRTPVLHIASHFSFVPGSDESFLLLGDGERLTLRDVRLGLRFDDVELLTLSACNTATGGGRRENGAEVEGLGRLAQDKGARAVLATLWPVADLSTAALMREFYRQHQQGHLDKAAALQAAQRAAIGGRLQAGDSATSRGATRPRATGESRRPQFIPDPRAPYAHPYYWAPFILMGNWL